MQWIAFDNCFRLFTSNCSMVQMPDSDNFQVHLGMLCLDPATLNLRLTKLISGVCKHCQFVFVSSVLSVMPVNGFPIIIMSAHAQCSICTCSVEGIPALVCLYMLSVGISLISMQCKHRKQCGKDEGFLAKMKKK